MSAIRSAATLRTAAGTARVALVAVLGPVRLRLDTDGTNTWW